MALKTPSTYKLVGLPPGLFGQTYVVFSVWKTPPSLWEAEYSILASRPDELLAQSSISCDLSSCETGEPEFGEREMETEAREKAEGLLEEELRRRALANGRQEWAESPIRLEPSRYTPASIWTLNTHPLAFSAMFERTKSNDLRSYLTMVSGTRRLRAATK